MQKFQQFLIDNNTRSALPDTFFSIHRNMHDFKKLLIHDKPASRDYFLICCLIFHPDARQSVCRKTFSNSHSFHKRQFIQLFLQSESRRNVLIIQHPGKIKPLNVITGVLVQQYTCLSYNYPQQNQQKSHHHKLSAQQKNFPSSRPFCHPMFYLHKRHRSQKTGREKAGKKEHCPQNE